MDLSWQPVTGAAQRRRGRRLRAAWRHEQQSIAQALAAFTHHSAPRRQTMARAGGWERVALHGQVPEHPTPQAAGAQHFAMDAGEDVGEAPAAGRPAPLLEVLPQERIQQRTAEQIVDTAPQTVEQLVEAPTIVSLIDVIRQPVEQPVDIPVRAWSGTGGRLQGFLPRQYSSSSVEQIADIPVPHHGIFGFQGFHPGQSSAASSEQLVDIPIPHGGPHLQDPGLASLPHEVAGEAFQGVFSTFLRRKKSAKIGPHSGSELLPESSPSTRAAHSDQFWEDESGGMWMLMPSGRWYLLCSSPEVFWDGPG